MNSGLHLRIDDRRSASSQSAKSAKVVFASVLPAVVKKLMHMEIVLSADIASWLPSVRSDEPVIHLKLMAGVACVVDHLIVDAVVESQLLILILLCLQIFLHLFDAVVRLVLRNLVDLDRQSTFFTIDNFFLANLFMLLELSFVNFLAAAALAIVSSEFTVFLVLQSLFVGVSNQARFLVHELRAVGHGTLESNVHEHVADELVNFDELHVPALHWAVRLLLLPLLDANFAEKGLALGAFFGVQHNLLANNAFKVVLLLLYRYLFLWLIVTLLSRDIGRG